MNRISFLNRLPTFNIKVLLIAIALIAVLFAVIRVPAKQAILRYQLKQLGATFVAWDEDGKISWLTLNTTRHLPEIVRRFDCSHVRDLDLHCGEIDSSIASANQFSDLEWLQLNSTNLDDTLARQITGVSAEVVFLDSTKLTRDGLESLLQSNQMDKITVYSTVITQEDAARLSKKYGVNVYRGPP
ncbi:hypothetical protein GC197_03245 [bacterium]|nr:hypothetical protein [bacterium]